jgi:hypothetical protein
VAASREEPQRVIDLGRSEGVSVSSTVGGGVRPDLVLIGLDLASWCGGCGRREEWVGVIDRQFPLPSHRVSVASMVQVASLSVDLH